MERSLEDGMGVCQKGQAGAKQAAFSGTPAAAQGHRGSPGRGTDVWGDRPISGPWLVRVTLLGRPGLVRAVLQGLTC